MGEHLSHHFLALTDLGGDSARGLACQGLWGLCKKTKILAPTSKNPRPHFPSSGSRTGILRCSGQNLSVVLDPAPASGRVSSPLHLSLGTWTPSRFLVGHPPSSPGYPHSSQMATRPLPPAASRPTEIKLKPSARRVQSHGLWPPPLASSLIVFPSLCSRPHSSVPGPLHVPFALGEHPSLDICVACSHSTPISSQRSLRGGILWNSALY